MILSEGTIGGLMHEPIWIESSHIQEMYDLRIGKYEDELLGSAIEEVHKRYHYGAGGIDLYDLAAVYGMKTARHAWATEKNETVAIIAVKTFLNANGAKYKATSNQEKEAIARVSSGRMDKEQFARWLRARA